MDACACYVVCGCKEWTRRTFSEIQKRLPGRWYFIGTREDLTEEKLLPLAPRSIFFLHWSWIVPGNILDRFECINFHMTDLPYGRGGSPLQNLILRGHRETKLTAHRMTREIDEGPVYLKDSLSLEGSAQEIFDRCSDIAVQMIDRIIHESPTPVPQQGEVVKFQRRSPEQSVLTDIHSLQEFYDFICMLDAEGYPRAFFTRNGFRYEFRNATLSGGSLTANVTITPLT